MQPGSGWRVLANLIAMPIGLTVVLGSMLMAAILVHDALGAGVFATVLSYLAGIIGLALGCALVMSVVRFLGLYDG